jgi:hypothetical protein
MEKAELLLQARQLRRLKEESEMIRRRFADQ